MPFLYYCSWYRSFENRLFKTTAIFQSITLVGLNRVFFLTNWDHHHILQTTISIAFSLNETCYISIKMSLNLIPKGLIGNIPALVQVMAWCHTGNKPLPEPMTIQFTLCTHMSPGLNELNLLGDSSGHVSVGHLYIWHCINTFRHKQNDQHFADDIFKQIFLNEKFCLLVKILPKNVKGAVNN